MGKRIGKQTLAFDRPPVIRSYATVAGRKEEKGPLGKLYDFIIENNQFGEKSWEKAEQKLQQYASELALEKGNLQAAQLDYYLGGDLLNQIVATSFTARALGVPFFGLYGACSSLVEAMILGSCLIDGNFAQLICACASSHHDAAERQLRYPTEMGVQRAPSTQWTVTGSGAYILGQGSGKWRITHAIPGRIVDRGVSNSSDMGTAMAAAAVDTIAAFLQDTKLLPHIDYIVTGDLGVIGHQICEKMLVDQGFDVKGKLYDCGLEVYHEEDQDVHAGGSGCGCSAVVLGARFLPEILKGAQKKLLMIGTGALLSPTTSYQGETVPGIAHGVLIETTEEGV